MERLEIRLPKELKEEFKKWCKKTVTTPSDELRRYIAKLVKEDERQ
jgi:predicted DNA-binding protein